MPCQHLLSVDHEFIVSGGKCHRHKAHSLDDSSLSNFLGNRGPAHRSSWSSFLGNAGSVPSQGSTSSTTAVNDHVGALSGVFKRSDAFGRGHTSFIFSWNGSAKDQDVSADQGSDKSRDVIVEIEPSPTVKGSKTGTSDKDNTTAVGGDKSDVVAESQHGSTSTGKAETRHSSDEHGHPDSTAQRSSDEIRDHGSQEADKKSLLAKNSGTRDADAKESGDKETASKTVVPRKESQDDEDTTEVPKLVKVDGKDVATTVKDKASLSKSQVMEPLPLERSADVKQERK